MKRLIGICLLLLVANVAVLLYGYSNILFGGGNAEAQSVGRIISGYAEPSNNPLTMARAEAQCRFWDSSYCGYAKAQRASVRIYFDRQLDVPVTVRSSERFQMYLASRAQLVALTSNYVSFLDTEPDNDAYVLETRKFETETNTLIGRIVSELHGMQEGYLREADKRNTFIFVVTYFNNIALLLMFFTFTRLRCRG